MDIFLDEELLVGPGRIAQETLQPLAFSTLADLVHHIRNELALEHLTKIVYLFSKNLQDHNLLFGIQLMSCKLLLNLVDCFVKKKSTTGILLIY